MMDCPKCGTPKMRTEKTYACTTSTIREKRCTACRHAAQTEETYLTEPYVIPNSIRRPKKETT